MNIDLAAMLRRDAGLRRLVRDDQVAINETAIQQAYMLRHGKQYQVRIMVSDHLDVLTMVRRDVLAGQSFTDLAIKHSTDISRQQGGLLSPISPADITYPKAIRDALPMLSMENTMSRLSQTMALDAGYALLWLEQILVPADPPAIEQVRGDLEAAIRSELERIRMRQLALALIEQANVVMLSPALDKAWQRQLDSMRGP